MTDLSRYFDYNATTPLSAVARAAWEEGSEQFWQNPSSLYREAGLARQALESCRERLADHLGIDEPERVIFTSGATEANNAIIRHWAESRSGTLLLSAVEHPCVEAPARAFFGDRVRELRVDPVTGRVDLDEFATNLKRGGIAAVSVMAANNETGTLQPWSVIARLCREAEVPFHTDAAQWIGKETASELGQCEFLTGSGHKFGGGKGVGFLVIPEAAEGFQGFMGGPQEEGRRAGTENLPAVMAMVAALEEQSDETLSAKRAGRASGRDAFETLVQASLEAPVVGVQGERLWNTSMVVLPHTKNLKWLTRLSQRGFSVSTGSACSAGSGNPSRVMAAMGLDFDAMGRVLRVSGGWETRGDDWSDLAAALIEVEQELRP